MSRENQNISSDYNGENTNENSILNTNIDAIILNKVDEDIGEEVLDEVSDAERIDYVNYRRRHITRQIKYSPTLSKLKKKSLCVVSNIREKLQKLDHPTEDQSTKPKVSKEFLDVNVANNRVKNLITFFETKAHDSIESENKLTKSAKFIQSQTKSFGSENSKQIILNEGLQACQNEISSDLMSLQNHETKTKNTDNLQGDFVKTVYKNILLELGKKPNIPPKLTLSNHQFQTQTIPPNKQPEDVYKRIMKELEKSTAWNSKTGITTSIQKSSFDCSGRKKINKEVLNFFSHTMTESKKKYIGRKVIIPKIIVSQAEM